MNDMPSGTTRNTPTKRRLVRGLLAGAAATALVGAGSLPAFAAPGDFSSDTVGAHIGITSAITLSGLTADFTINASIVGTTLAADAVAYTVNTNNVGGYNVTVNSESPTLTAAQAGNTDTIPIASLGVRLAGAAAFTPMAEAKYEITNKATRSAAGGDDYTNDFSITPGFVADGTYSTVLDYIATAN
jgi:hypothetical protein